MTHCRKNKKLKLALYNDFGEKAQSIFDWLNHSDSNQSDSKPVIDKAETIYPDGVYYLYKDGSKELFDFIGQNKPQKEVKRIGVKMGEHSIAIGLKGLQEQTLTIKENDDDYNDYVYEHDDAVADWNGKLNTKHIRQTGTDIELADDEWIPSIAELYLIYINKRSINSAIELSSGVRLGSGWYWSSTEESVGFAWSLNFVDGNISKDPKNIVEFYVCAVTEFKAIMLLLKKK